MLFLVQHITAQILEQCDLPKTDGYTITNYYREKCGPCDRVTHFLNEIHSRLERNNYPINFRYVDCTVCDCPKDKIEKVPTIAISKGEKEINRFMGFQEFGEIVEFIIENTDIERGIFKKRIESTPGKVVDLQERDFQTSFDGPWLILFTSTESDLKKELIEQIAEEYESNLNVGQIKGKSVPNLLQRFSIPTLPALLAFHGGLLVGYNGKDTIENLREFVDELIRPSFPTLSYEEFKERKNKLVRGEPLFLVFYKDLSAANDYFQNISHEYKFRAKIFKSEDKELMNQAGVDLSQKDMYLVVYRNGVFHQSDVDLSSRDEVFNWIFHTHYPFLTQVTNETIYMVLHGIKPVVLLLSREDEYVDDFESIAEQMHKGQPFIEKVFASLDVAEYSLFVPKMLPGLDTPTVVILNPTTSTFYAMKKKLAKNNIQEFVYELIQKYDSNKLDQYPYKKSHMRNYIIIFMAICGLYLAAKMFLTKKAKIVY